MYKHIIPADLWQGHEVSSSHTHQSKYRLNMLSIVFLFSSIERRLDTALNIAMALDKVIFLKDTL